MILETMLNPTLILEPITDIVAMLMAGRISMAEASDIVAKRDAAGRTVDRAAHDEAHAMNRAYRKGKAMQWHEHT